MSEHDYRLYAKGGAFDDGRYDLRSMELLVSSYRSITDRLIAVQLGRRQITPQIRDQINYQVQIKPGSIEFLIEFIFSHKELLGALAVTDAYQLSEIIFKLYKAAIDLRKEVAGALKNGFPITITINNNLNIGNGNLIANNGNGNISIGDPKILWAAQATKYPTDRLISGIDGREIEYVELGTKSDGLRITTNERILLGQNREELSATLRVYGRLDMVSVSSHKGIVISNQEKFPVRWDEQIRGKIARVVDVEGVEFIVKPIIDQNRLHSDAIAYHVLDCGIPQQKMDF